MTNNARIPDFPYIPCPKCGQIDWRGPQFRRAFGCFTCNEATEHLHFSCPCGYSLRRSTLDSNPTLADGPSTVNQPTEEVGQ